MNNVNILLFFTINATQTPMDSALLKRFESQNVLYPA